MTVSLEHRYRPRGSALTVLSSRAPELLVSGPAGTGKSRACLEKLLIVALQNPGVRILLVRKTAVSLTSTALVTWKTHVAAEVIASGYCTYFGGSPHEPPCYRFRNGARIVIGGMDKPSRIMSSEYDMAYVQEATELTIEDWEAITTRLRNGVLSFQQIIADANPNTPTHWLRERCLSGRTVMLESRHWENPRLYSDDRKLTEAGASYMARLDALTGVRKQRLRDGLWVAAEGLIYEEFDPAIHVVDKRPWDFPDEWTRWWSIDWGQTNPFSLSRWAEDPDGRLYLYRQLYRTKRLVEDHARDVLLDCTKPVGGYTPRGEVSARTIRDDVEAGRRRWTEPKPRGIVVDPAGAEERKTFTRHTGLQTIPAKKTGTSGQPSMKTLGIQAVQARFKPAGDGRPRLFICRDAVVERDQELVEAKLPTCSLEELPGYVWAVGADGKRKEEPVDEHNHGMDEMRYLVAFRDLRARPQIRFF